jgi:hypothetical protein
MSLDYLANLAEISSGIIVVVTLVFLVIQIRDNTKALRVAAIEDFYNAYLELAADTNRVPDVATASQKAFTNQPMDPIDNHHFCVYVQRACSILERGLIMVQEGILDQKNFEMVSLQAKMVCATSAGRYWYYFLKTERGLFRPELHQWMEDFYAEQDRQVALEKVASSNTGIDNNSDTDVETPAKTLTK